MAVELDPRAAGVDSVDQGHALAAGIARVATAPTIAMTTSPSSTTAWATCARSRRRSSTSRRDARVVRHRRPGGRSARAERVVLPGQGAMPDCMRELARAGCARRCSRPRATSRSSASASACRCCSTRSEEGADARPRRCSPGEVVRFRDDGDGSADGERLKVPHMGWNQVRQARAASALGGHRRRRAASISCTATTRAPADPALTAGDGRLPAPLYLRGGAG